MEEDRMQLTTKQVAEVFQVAPTTVSMWSRTKRLKGKMPRNARRTGRRFTVAEVRAFAQSAEDEGYSERQFEEWLATNRDRLLSRQGGGDSSTPVLISKG